MNRTKINLIVIATSVFLILEMAISLFVLLKSTQDLTPSPNEKEVQARLVRLDLATYERVKKEKFQR